MLLPGLLSARAKQILWFLTQERPPVRGVDAVREAVARSIVSAHGKGIG